MKYGGTNDTRIKARLRNEAEVKSRRAKKREKERKKREEDSSGGTQHILSRFRTVGVYLFIN